MICAGMIVAALINSPARAEEAYCLPCQSARWKSIEDQLLLSAENIKKARELLRLAERQAGSHLLEQTRANFANASAQWQAILLNARALGGNTYKTYLARNLVDAEANYDLARAELGRKTAQFDLLRVALADQRERILKDMEGTLEIENKQRWKLGADSFFEMVHSLAERDQMRIDALRREASAGTEQQSNIEKLERRVQALEKLEAAKRGYQFGKREYLDLGVDASRLAAEAFTVGTAAFPYVVAIPGLTILALDASSVGLSYQQWHEANQRLEDVRSVEIKWQVDMGAVKASLRNANMVRQMASDAIMRQQQLEMQLGIIEAEVIQ